jgi:hypothetical protein
VAQQDSLKAGGESGQSVASIDLPDPPAFRGYPLRGLGLLLTRVRARLEHSRLDAALAQGADPCKSHALAHRAAQLTSDRTREKMAAWIEDIVARAGRDPSGKVLDVYSRAFSAAVEPDRDEVAAAEMLLTQVEDFLGSNAPVYARGVALLEDLLRDGGGPVYRPSWPGELSHQLELIIAALEGREHHERRPNGYE